MMNKRCVLEEDMPVLKVVRVKKGKIYAQCSDFEYPINKVFTESLELEGNGFHSNATTVINTEALFKCYAACSVKYGNVAKCIIPKGSVCYITDFYRGWNITSNAIKVVGLVDSLLIEFNKEFYTIRIHNKPTLWNKVINYIKITTYLFIHKRIYGY